MTHLHDARPRPRTAPETVRRVIIQLVEGREDAAAWDRLLARHHYLGRSRLVGEALRYVAVVDGEPVALVGFARAARKVGVRDAAMGWTPDQREDRLRYVVNNARFVILPRFQIANLGSHVLGLTLRRLQGRAGVVDEGGVPFDGHHVGRVFVLHEIAGGLRLRMPGIEGDHRARPVERAAQVFELRDLVGLGVHQALSRDLPGAVDQRGQHVDRSAGRHGPSRGDSCRQGPTRRPPRPRHSRGNA